MSMGIIKSGEYNKVAGNANGEAELLRNLHDPDWSQAEDMTFVSNKWTATKRGIVVIYLTKSTLGNGGFLVNDVRITDAYSDKLLYTAGTAAVSPGDVVTITGNANIGSAKFVPYKAQ